MLARHSLRSPQCEEERRSEAVSPLRQDRSLDLARVCPLGGGGGGGHTRCGFPPRQFTAGAFSAGEESGTDSSYNLFLTFDLLNWKKPNPPS